MFKYRCHISCFWLLLSSHSVPLHNFLWYYEWLATTYWKSENQGKCFGWSARVTKWNKLFHCLIFWPIGWIWSIGWNKLKCFESRLQRHEWHAFEFFSVRQYWQFCQYYVKYLHLAELLFRWKEITKPTRSWTVSVNFCSIKISLLNRLHYWHLVLGCLVINSYLFKNFSFYLH